jgi:hypothetical protein
MGESMGDAMFKPLLLDRGVDVGTIGVWTGVHVIAVPRISFARANLLRPHAAFGFGGCIV